MKKSKLFSSAFILKFQGSNKFARQLSSPAYFNPKIRMNPNMATALIKNSSMGGNFNPNSGRSYNKHDYPDSPTRSYNGFPNNPNNGPIRRPQPR